jgi:hypothetical protein
MHLVGPFARPSLPVQLKKCDATGLDRSEAIRRLVELGVKAKKSGAAYW